MCSRFINWKAIRRENRVSFAKWAITAILIIIFLLIILYYITKSFDKCDGFFGDSFGLNLRKHENFDKFKQGRCSDDFKVNKSEVEEHKFPFIARLVFRNDTMRTVFCAGTLISANLVLTVAHCLNDIKVSDLELYIGGTAQDEFRDALHVHRIKEFIKYDKYNRTTNVHDIALIRLEKDVPLTSVINVACLPLDQDNVPKNLTLSGYHNLSVEMPQLTETVIGGLEKLNCSHYFFSTLNNVMSTPDVSMLYRPIDITQFCAGEKTIAKGNSGMPVHERDEKSGASLIYGMVSYGVSKNDTNVSPTVFTKIHEYRHWILCNA